MSQTAIIDIIKVNKLIKSGHENESISYKNYSSSVKPSIEEFREKYEVSPNKYLKKYLTPIHKGLPEDYKIANYQHYGNNKFYNS